jgi:hypothetical protein
MCDILVREIQANEHEASDLPHNLCTHVLFRIVLEDGKVPTNLTDGKVYLFVFIILIRPWHINFNRSLTSHFSNAFH